EQGFLFSDPLQETQYRMQLTGAQGWIMYEWRIGEPFDPEQAEIFYGPVPDDDAIFVDGYLELEGVFMGKATIGAHGSYDNNDLGKHCIRLLDDVRYWFANPYTGAFNDTTGGYEDRLLIISESNITIGNTWENGRENRSYGADIIITAGLIALGNEAEPHFWGCFSFEDQNDVGFTWEFSTGSYICPTPPSNDERGAIHLWGSLAQQRRGYVHRSNHSGTGYGRDYHYDNRFRYFDFVADIPANHNPLLWPEDIDFGEVQIGDSLILQTMLSNLGGTYIDINGATTSTSLFELVAGDTTVSLIPGDSRLYEIQFTPQELGEHTDTLLIDLQFGEDLYVPLRGIGTTLGISEPGHRPESFQLSAFPNPFNNEVRLSWTGLHDQGLLSIFDTFGREVYRAVVTPGINHLVWQPHHLSTGLYFLQLRTNDLTTTSKIVYVK
ncbi:T9SS type A sorting domain-containing protein, partial [bacterium]|nr:T9SS type A sorting domain-containing protein [bacterium]